MIGRSLLAVRPMAGRMQVRGKAIKNWKRPSMDELLVPTEPWAQANARRQSRYNMMMIGGFSFLAATIAFGNVRDLYELRGVPHHIIAEMKHEK